MALPGALFSASSGVRMIAIALEMDVILDLRTAFHEAVWDSVLESLQILHHRPLPLPIPTSFESGVRTGMFFQVSIMINCCMSF